ncbi:SDR family NAD(P)-dependent oxidoreductase [Tunicatimonas pelagia]|uniref:SDR family NAD(P)-dependent oxidoreductase n=1 Tax=Tunicatimonas pelagia TaxID=931531 RepID=UPI002666FB6A|nr:SDR family oxidoreductase [Tunicatimonas pelagia]WKN44831.1 SDR family oxidoreductase [Tunicatimonas pelagia]
MFNLDRKVALVTGGSRGLGAQYALQLAEAGSDIILTYRSNRDEAEASVERIKQVGRQAVGLPLDVADHASFDNFAERVTSVLQERWERQQFDFLINNAGIDSHSLIAQTSEETFDQVFNVHFKGVYFLTQRALPLLADGGRIINISTGLARFSFPGYGAYASAKGAVEVFTRYLAKELGDRKITANVVAPGVIETDFTAPAFEHNPQMKDMLAQQTALGRVGQPEDVSGVIAFLCSDEARWITGQRLEASGGMFL